MRPQPCACFGGYCLRAFCSEVQFRHEQRRERKAEERAVVQREARTQRASESTTAASRLPRHVTPEMVRKYPITVYRYTPTEGDS